MFMQKSSLVLHDQGVCTEETETTQRRARSIHFVPKGLIMFILLAVIGVVAVAAIVGSFVLLSRDGYGRIAERKNVRIY